MTSPWPNSPLLNAVLKLKRMVALSDALQTRAGLTYAELLADRIFLEYVPAREELYDYAKTDRQILMPFAAIWPMVTGSRDVAGGSQVWMIPNGTLHLYMACRPLPGLTGWNEIREEAIGFLDQWMNDICDLSGSNDTGSSDGFGHLTIRKADSPLLDHVPFKDRESAGNHFYRSVAVTYGDEG